MGGASSSRMAANKKKSVKVDKEKSLEVIENQEFIAMRPAEKVWPALTIKEDQLNRRS